ncbi:MAG: sodium:calcium antiporter [Deltaproteobacteria bacterium]|nr:MAG: sodium:calcium antiporter [Deltaproteobacteria bacterium]
MDVALDVARLLFGGLVLYVGAEWLVKGSAGLARAYGVKPLVIGLTVVAYGTSAPELAVSTIAAVDGKPAIVVGNVVGSCIANLGLILGVTALISPPAVDARLIKREVPVLLLSVAVVPLVVWASGIAWWEGLLLFAASVAFTVWTLSVEAGVNVPAADEIEATAEIAGAPSGSGKARMYAVTAAGMALLIGGGDVFVDGAVGVARSLGMTERVVGLTIIAVGTSLPELAASLVAALRGHADIAVGNVVGSNIFNVFLILGIVPMVRHLDVSLASVAGDLYFLAGVTLLGAFTMRGDRRVTRVEGALLAAAYLAFLAFAFGKTG